MKISVFFIPFYFIYIKYNLSSYILKSREKFWIWLKGLQYHGCLHWINMAYNASSADVSETFACKRQNHYFVSKKYLFKSIIIPNVTNNKNEIDFKTLLG